MKRGKETEKTSELKIRIEPEVKAELFKQANCAGFTLSEYVRKLVNKDLNGKTA